MVLIISLALLISTAIPPSILLVNTFHIEGDFLPSNGGGLLLKIGLFASTIIMTFLLFTSETVLNDIVGSVSQILDFITNTYSSSKNKLKELARRKSHELRVMMIRPIQNADDVIQNDDLLMEILLRLPPESLFTLKSVSRRWYVLVFSPRFAFLWQTKPVSGLFLYNNHAYNPPLPRELIYISLKRIHSNPLDHLEPITPLKFPVCFNTVKGLTISNSCNGLLLLKYFNTYFVYNPTTNMDKTLPPLLSCPKKQPRGANLAFDPSKSPYYKVVVWLRDEPKRLVGGRYSLEIYSSKTCTWRAFQDKEQILASMDEFDVMFPTGRFWNGAIIWEAPRYRSLYIFEIDQEHLREITFPPTSFSAEDVHLSLPTLLYFGESGGHLNVVYNGDYGYEVLELEKDYSRFSFKYLVHDLTSSLRRTPWVWTVNPDRRMSHDFTTTVPWFYSYNILTLVHGEAGEDSYLLFVINRNLLISYNLKNRSLGFLGKLCWEISGSIHHDVHHYNMSIFNPSAAF